MSRSARRHSGSGWWVALGVAGATVLAGCDDPGIATVTIDDDGLTCDLDASFLADGGVGRDGIPALTNPTFLPAEPRVDATSYFLPTDRVIGYWNNGEWLVIPHNIMWRHEIVNLPEVTITYCPLTGSALAFARSSVGGAEFGVSGLLYNANLILYDRTQPEASFWPQMLGEARCGPRTGQELTRVPVFEMTAEAWFELHPDSKVLAITPDMFDPALYFFSPYGTAYENPHNPDYLGFPMTLDERRPPKERVLGIPRDGAPALAYPFLAMDAVGTSAVFEFEHEGTPAVVLWDGVRRSAMAFESAVNAQATTFRATGSGFVDSATGTTWTVDGSAVAGPLAGGGTRLRAVPSAYVAFWGSWAAFHPNTELAVTGGA
ncbi:MAG: DUF3179 domain-containing protein [Longimicrobiales bacterium]